MPWTDEDIEAVLKPVNPKAARAEFDKKPPLELLEPAADAEISWVMAHGAEKYGIKSYKLAEIKLTTYIGALERHVAALKRGEMYAPDSGKHHLAHIGADVHVTLGALEAGKLVDDTQFMEVKTLHSEQE